MSERLDTPLNQATAMRVGVLPFPLGTPLVDLMDSWVAAEEVGFHALWTIDHATATADLSPAWDAASLLIAMAARTRTIPIGVLVFDVLLRHPFQVAGSVAVAQAMSGGRVRVGLGIGDGFSRLDHDALGLPFPPFADRVRALEACCTALPALWRGEPVTEPLLGMNEAALGSLHIEAPPVIVAGGSRSVMEVAARHAQGWNLVTQDPSEFEAGAKLLTTMESLAGRREPLSKSVLLFVERMDRDLRAALADFGRVGAEETVLVVEHPTRDAVLELASRVM